MKIVDWQLQAEHFDSSEPFVPVSWKVRKEGFQYHYILKDYAISEAIKGIELAPHAKVLDAGCGTGVNLDRLDRSYKARGFGIDVSAKSLARHRETGQGGRRNSRADARRIPFSDNTFDLAISFDVLEHMESPERAVREMIRVTRPGGNLVLYAVSRDNRFTWIRMLTSMYEFLGIDHWSWSCHSPDLLVDPKAILEAIDHSNCDIVSFEPFHSFFALLFDHFLQVGWVISEQIGITREDSKLGIFVGNLLLRASSFLCRNLRDAIKILDSPWSSRGFSNGILVVAQKQKDQPSKMSEEHYSEFPTRVEEPVAAREAAGLITHPVTVRNRSGQ